VSGECVAGKSVADICAAGDAMINDKLKSAIFLFCVCVFVSSCVSSFAFI
jgi:hypothetical protein